MSHVLRPLTCLVLILLPGLAPCATPRAFAGVVADAPTVTSEILVTSARGDRLALQANVPFRDGIASGTVVSVFPDSLRQVIDGIGTSFTESSAFVLAHLEPSRRREVMERIFGAAGADFTLTRTHIGSCDFSVAGKYSYAAKSGDRSLKHFTIAPDLEGFDPARWAGVKDARYDLLPMIQEAQAIKRAGPDSTLRIIASAWTAPPWMKDNDTWYIPGSPENKWQGSGGSLKAKYLATYADYLVRYLDAYRDAGVPIWGLTPVNEPNGNGGNWESMNFSPESQRDFIRNQLGPRLFDQGHRDVKLLVYDQNRDDLERWADTILSDRLAASYSWGTAIHWYESTFKVYEDALERVHARFPDKALVHTEGCIDNLGNKAGGGITDPAGYEESGWFQNDAFWWRPNATDWAYTATWAGPGAADHPVYTPVHRYARNIIVSLDHWVSGWVDWNIVLDRQGGPNHVGNFCGAPIMIDTATQEVYYTPIFSVLEQFSRTIRPGDRAVATHRALAGLDADALHACATLSGAGVLSVQLLNTTPEALPYALQIGGHYATVEIPANAVQTVRVALR